jgi:hypothetical protein
VVTVVAITAAISAVAGLPIVPVGTLHDTPIIAMNYDAGEQVGWPAFAHTIAGVYHSVPTTRVPIVLTENYGEAGAVLRYAPDVHRVFAGQNSLWDLGPPPARSVTAVAIGYPESDLKKWFHSVRLAAHIDNHHQVDNDEQDRPVWVCGDPTGPWSTLWPKMRRLG